MTSNNHGSIECVQGQWYVFYHRHTHKSSYSRQACAEPICLAEDGHIKQVELSTSGLAGRSMPATGVYAATRACVITNGHMPHIPNGILRSKRIPYITHEGDERFITNIRNGTTVGFRYFSFRQDTTISITTRGAMSGKLFIQTEMDSTPIGEIPLTSSSEWQADMCKLNIEAKISPLYLVYKGTGSFDLLSIAF